MLVFIVMPESKDHAVQVKRIVQRGHHRNRATGADHIGRFAIDLFEDLPGNRGRVVACWHKEGIGAAGILGHLCRDAGRAMGSHMRGNQVKYLFWVLIRHQAAGDLG